VYYTPNGYDPDLFFDKQTRSGALTIGWAGAPLDRVKGYYDILQPACQDRFELRVAGGELGHAQMNKFYNEIDVLAVASKHEGEPLTLIESMAAGCFPVCTDVGIVPELVETGVNGLIVNRSPEAFRSAFEWCRSNTNFVRSAGSGNAQKMLRERRWTDCIPYFRRLFNETLDRLNQ
jgi:glycosyltransferase involved in cell wall biosynthesis